MLLLSPLDTAWAAEIVGQRPYEMVWAGRTDDDHPPLIDFEDLTGWRVECKDGKATLERTREQQLFGRYVAKLTYRGEGATPEVRILPPRPVAANQAFDAVTLWVYGNNWGWTTDPSTPQVGITALFEDAAGREFSVRLHTVNWKEWFLLHKRLAGEQIDRAKTGAKFKGLLVTGGRNSDNRVLFFDNLAVFTEQFPPLQFEPRPQRGIAMFPGQSPGVNSGPGKLPFPTRSTTILPDNLVAGYKNALRPAAEGYEFTYEGPDGRLVYRVKPDTGTWSDINTEWTPASAGQEKARPVALQPCVDGGVLLATAKGEVAPEKAEHLGTQAGESAVESRWRLSAAGVSAEVTYNYRMWGKSLVIDVLAPGGNIAEVRFGRAVGLANPRLVTNPFYPAEGGRPAVAVGDAPQGPVFLTGNADWYLSNASTLRGANSIAAQGVIYNGGTRYVPLTNGKRNDCFERFFVTISPRYEEMLPRIANPPSPWKQITGTRLWRAHGASNREHDARYWENVHRHGMTQVVVTDHETIWRDEGESFTFRTRAAPGKGGDKGAFDYARLMQDKLGFVYGPYNNYTDFAPVNEFWNVDMVSRDPQNQLQHAWMRCYAPKPARAVEYCARLAPQIQEKFKFSTAYCDVHTAVAPWHRVDYDPRVPGAGTFAAVFYAYGEIMLHQKKAWSGPVYSEGNYHCFYMGLTDGNYGQDQSYQLAENPWLVDFDLRRMHDLGCNFGMGNLEMFYSNVRQPRNTPEERDAELDRFLAATVAFGHPGFLVMEGGMGNALRSYYMLQQLHSRYCLASAADIRYATGDGKLLDTSHAVASGDYKRSQVVVRYSDGTITAANGSKTERMVVEAFGRKLDLPPNGYAGWTADGVIDVLSGDMGGKRCDYAATPAYLYVDGRGQFVRFTKAAGNGAGICRVLPNGQYEIIPHNGAECGFAVEATKAVALDKDRNELGPAPLRVSRGLTYVVPVKGAFSYLLSNAGIAPETRPKTRPALSCDRDRVVPGERVDVRGEKTHQVRIPESAQPGQRLWIDCEGAAIDFTVVPLADIQPVVEDNVLGVRLTSHLKQAEDFTLAFKTEQRIRLEPDRPTLVTLDATPPREAAEETLPLILRSGPMSQRMELRLRTALQHVSLTPLAAKWTGGIGVRRQPEAGDMGTTGASVHTRSIDVGGVHKAGLFMHPPYQGGVGYAFALYDPVSLPSGTPAAFRGLVGKEDGSDLGDGILFKLAVVDSTGTETVVAQTTVAKHEWTPLAADLSRWAGKTVRLKLIADVGVKDDSSGDWACWADMRIESLQLSLRRAIRK